MLIGVGKIVAFAVGTEIPKIGMTIAHYQRAELLAKRHRLSISKRT